MWVQDGFGLTVVALRFKFEGFGLGVQYSGFPKSHPSELKRSNHPGRLNIFPCKTHRAVNTL